jgi:hypothetical protein
LTAADLGRGADPAAAQAVIVAQAQGLLAEIQAGLPHPADG